jgi:hypothetical protein
LKKVRSSTVVSMRRIVKDAHLPLVQIRGHALGIADLRQGAKHQHPVPAAQHPIDLSRTTLGQQFYVHSKMIINSALFGSGYAGLGV